MLIWARSPLLSASFEDENSGLDVGWRPDLDVFELAHEYVLSVSLPGVRPEDVDVTVLGRVLTVSGERAALVAGQAVAHLIESPRGRFGRRIRLPANSDVSNMRVQMGDGQLVVSLPKAPPRPTRVTISTVH